MPDLPDDTDMEIIRRLAAGPPFATGSVTWRAALRLALRALDEERGRLQTASLLGWPVSSWERLHLTLRELTDETDPKKQAERLSDLIRAKWL